ncbi:hypothetical protein CCP3SC15_1280012 [Gammaproteobacteria bacterium]
MRNQLNIGDRLTRSLHEHEQVIKAVMAAATALRTW